MLTFNYENIYCVLYCWQCYCLNFNKLFQWKYDYLLHNQLVWYSTINHYLRGVISFISKMAASCCGVKKQKLNNSMPSNCCNGSSVHPKPFPTPSNGLVIQEEMCYFCFDVLFSHLFNTDLPIVPSFTNDQ